MKKISVLILLLCITLQSCQSFKPVKCDRCPEFTEQNDHKGQVMTAIIENNK